MSAPMLPRQVQRQVSRPSRRQRPIRPEDLPAFTLRQKTILDQELDRVVKAPHWHGQLPVMLLDRCWLKLRAIPVEQLAQVLPPDTSSEAPELVQFRELVARGESAWAAEQQCWQDFGAAAWHQALNRFWIQQERGNHNWTLQRYLDLLERYRQPFTQGGSRQIPLVVLARQDHNEPHGVAWVKAGGLTMRHTCL